jgi:hypothetical protein
VAKLTVSAWANEVTVPVISGEQDEAPASTSKQYGSGFRKIMRTLYVVSE